ncbi:ABC transporter permease [Hymenobacter metallicola]|uniref:ABC transporter permease n=1 Tax=Hymenobacter metallicola TaxID=2563114 RepID=UPI0014367120|nr:ABC transporter permease [Hymenobacter metallicola]
MGRSFRDNQPVTTLVSRALTCTLPLTIGAFITIAGAGWGLTLLLAHYRSIRPVVVTALHFLQTLPLFVVALLLLLLLANPDFLDWFPAYGLARPENSTTGLYQLLSSLYHSVLPLFSLVLVSLPSFVVQWHNALQQELKADYILTARAKGVRPSLVIRRHALRNALLPAITYLTDLLPALVAGAVVVELIFALPGMGRLIAESAAARDFPVVLSGVVLIALVRLLAQILADWLYYQADPRIKLEA